MIKAHQLNNRRLLPAFVCIVFILTLLGSPSAVFAAGWSPAVTISPSSPSSAPNAFAFDPAGNELWVTAPGVTGGALVQVAQRSFGGAWSSLATIDTIQSVGFVVVSNLSISLSANGYAAAAWSVGGGVNIELRSPAGTWQAPVSFSQDGGASGLRVGLDAQGNGAAAWQHTTSAGQVIDAVTWTAAGAFGNVVQLSPSSQGAALPDLAVNEVGTAVVAWQAFAPGDNGNPDQIEAATRPAGGSWSAVTAASPVMSQTWNPKVALDGSGNATVVWEQGATANNYLIYAATRPVNGGWGSPVRIEPSDWYMAGQASVASDAAGNVTASWVVDNSSGSMFIHTATLSAGGGWGAPTNLGPCQSNGGLLCLTPPVAVARDGSIAVVGWTALGGLTNQPNVAVRLGSGQWVSMIISGTPKITYILATNNARASAVWPAPNGVKYHVAIKQSDCQ